jgi:hypothetical protein
MAMPPTTIRRLKDAARDKFHVSYKLAGGY